MIDIDTRLFWFINSHHAPWADTLLWTASQPWSWAIVLTLIYLCITLRKEPHQWWIILIGIGLCFLLSDRISVMCFKDVVCRLRPCHALEGVRMYRTSCGGSYGFVSSHAANVFALAMFFALRYGHRRAKGWIVPAVMFGWAAIVGYSRPYLGKHYPGDVICGAIVGIAMGALVYFVTKKIENRLKYKTLTKKKQQ